MIKVMRSFFIIMAVSCVFARGSLFADTLDKIIVIVNGETVTKAELDAAVGSIAEKVRKESTEADFPAKLESYRKDILNRMVEEKLILSAAKKKDMKIEPAEIEDKLKEVKSRFESEEKFNNTLRDEDISLRDLKQKYSDQIRVSRLVDQEVRKKVAVAPSEMLNYYEAHKEDFKTQELVKVKNILIKPDETHTDEEAMALAQKVEGFLKAGESFDELALRYSKGPNADRGGDLGFVKRAQMMKVIDDIIFSLEAGQISDVIKTDLGYHIFKVEEKRMEGVKPFSEAKEEIEKSLYIEKAKTIYSKWIEDLKKNAYISYR